MTFKLYHNQRSVGRPWFHHGRLPIKQRLYFIGNWLVVVRPASKVTKVK